MRPIVPTIYNTIIRDVEIGYFFLFFFYYTLLYQLPGSYSIDPCNTLNHRKLPTQVAKNCEHF